MGIDYGGKRIGIATSDSGVLATPHSVIDNSGDVVGRIAAIGQALETETFVVGIAREQGIVEIEKSQSHQRASGRAGARFITSRTSGNVMSRRVSSE